MKWFQSGLNEAQLKQEYKTLAKIHHPDRNGNSPQSIAEMQEINDEFDSYFVAIKQENIGVNWDDLFSRYAAAYEAREAILHYMNWDKKPNHDVGRESGGWFTLHSYISWMCGTRTIKSISDDGPEWEDFHGGFALVHPYGKDDSGAHPMRLLKRIPAKIECPTVRDMYFAMHGQRRETTEIQIRKAPETSGAHVSEYGTYQLIRTKRRGCMWINQDDHTQAFMLVNGLVMSTDIPKHLLKDAEILRTISGDDLGFFQWQDCSYEQFKRQHDVDYLPEYANVLGCKRLKDSNQLYWIDDPIVSHFARLGVVQFWESGENFRMRFGTFNSVNLKEHLHELSIDDAELIQDFLDKINSEFEEYVKRLIKKGKIIIEF